MCVRMCQRNMYLFPHISNFPPFSKKNNKNRSGHKSVNKKFYALKSYCPRSLPFVLKGCEYIPFRSVVKETIFSH